MFHVIQVWSIVLGSIESADIRVLHAPSELMVIYYGLC